MSSKLEGPGSSLSFLGFELDSRAMVIRLPLEKLRELQSLVREWSDRDKCKKKDLQLLVGKLAHACKVVWPGKTFLRQMFELLAGTRKSHHFIRLNAAFQSDVRWWETFMGSWNGISLLNLSRCLISSGQTCQASSGAGRYGAHGGYSCNGRHRTVRNAQG